MATDTIEFAFPETDTGKANLLLPMIPEAPASKGLAVIADQVTADSTVATATAVVEPTVLSCSALLLGETRTRAEQEAVKLLDEMLANPSVLSNYGQDALKGINDLVDRLLHERQPVESEAVRSLMKDLSRSMRGVSAKYDPSDPENLEKYEKTRGWVLRKLHLGKTFIEEFLDDIRSLEGKFSKVTEELSGAEQRLLRNVQFYDEFYKLNEKEIIGLIYVIGVMELVRDLAAKRAEAIPVGDAAAGDRGNEKKANVAEFVSLMENKIAAYKGRLWVAWSMSPQIRMLRTVSAMLAERVNETIHVGIPTMKSTVVVWNTMSETAQIEQVNAAVEEIINNAMQGFAKAAAVTVPRIAKAMATPSLRPDTVMVMAQSISDQADGIIEAIELGAQKRAELDQAMLDGQRVLTSATDRVSDAQIKHVLEVARAADAQAQTIEIATSVPAA